MRPKFVTTVLLLSILLTAGMWWLKNGLSGTKAIGNSGETSARLISSPVRTVPRRTTARVVAENSTPEQQRAVIDGEVERLTELSLKRDPASLPEIFAALTNPDREVREAALDAVTQVGDSNAIPVLKEASEMVDSPEEKVGFLEAMEFLAVPPLNFDASDAGSNPDRSEIAERRRAERDQESRGVGRIHSGVGNLSSAVMAH